MAQVKIPGMKARLVDVITDYLTLLITTWLWWMLASVSRKVLLCLTSGSVWRCACFCSRDLPGDESITCTPECFTWWDVINSLGVSLDLSYQSSYLLSAVLLISLYLGQDEQDTSEHVTAVVVLVLHACLVNLNNCRNSLHSHRCTRIRTRIHTYRHVHVYIMLFIYQRTQGCCPVSINVLPGLNEIN